MRISVFRHILQREPELGSVPGVDTVMGVTRVHGIETEIINVSRLFVIVSVPLDYDMRNHN